MITEVSLSRNWDI